MDFSSDDSAADPDFRPESLSELSDSMSSFSSEENITLAQLRERSPPFQDIEEQQNVPSTSGTTSLAISQDFVNQKLANMVWQNCNADDPPNFEFTGEYTSGMKDVYRGILADADPLDYYELFLTDDIVTLIVNETNLYATQELTRGSDISAGSRLHAWVPTNKLEIMRFLALIGWMGLVKCPAIRDYWRRDELYGLPLARRIMPRNRFELLLKFIHFANNAEAPNDDRLFKLRLVMNKFIHNFQQAYTPGKRICIDESLIPWRGRLLFRQYIPNMRHKYGMKVFKLCSDRGYTWNLMVYSGRLLNPTTGVAETVVMELIDGLLDEGRVLYTDNWYTSIPLAYKLQHRKTHLVGTLRLNRKHLPSDVVAAKLRRGQIAAKETNDGIMVLKWRDKRIVSALSTKHSGLKMSSERTRTNQTVSKPACIVDYNTGKSSIDLSDQMASYHSALRRCTKWYRKLFFEVLWGTSIVNAHFLYSENTRKKQLKITEFREEVIKGMLRKYAVQEGPSTSTLTPRPPSNKRHRHVWNMKGNPPKKCKGRCVECYKIYGRKGKTVDGKVKLAKQTSKICSVCQTLLCEECFEKLH